MKRTFIFCIILILNYSTHIEAQSTENKHKALADKVFNLKIKSRDFQHGKVFLTLDTMNAHDFTAPSDYTEYTDPKPLIRKFKHFMQSCNWDGGYFHYGELINSPFYQSTVHLIFFMNDDKNTYRIDIWNSVNDVTKIEGISVAKYLTKIEKTDM